MDYAKEIQKVGWAGSFFIVGIFGHKNCMTAFKCAANNFHIQEKMITLSCVILLQNEIIRSNYIGLFIPLYTCGESSGKLEPVL